jgi:hypothetical protein
MTTLFDYELTGTGWAETVISNGDKTLTFQVSYLSDPIADLLEGLLRLHTKKTNQEKITFAEEPGEHSLVLTLQSNNTLNIEIYWSDEWEPISKAYGTTHNKELLYSDTDTLKSFTAIVCDCMQRLLDKYGSNFYKEKWHLYGFPEQQFVQLKAISEGG